MLFLFFHPDIKISLKTSLITERFCPPKDYNNKDASKSRLTCLFKHQTQTLQYTDTLVLLLQQEIQELHQGVRLMRQESLIKNVAKRKVLYNISQTGMLELVYSYFALAEYYIHHDLLSPALKAIQDSRLLKIVGDSTFLMGQVFYKKGSKLQAVRHLQACLQEQWIEPSQLHQIGSKLEAMTYLQQLYFNSHQRDKLIKLSEDKIKLTQMMGGSHSDSYFQALSLFDMSMIHDSFAEYQPAIDKLQNALTLLSTSNEAPAKQIEMLQFRGSLFGKIGKRMKEAQSYKQVVVNLFSVCPSQRNSLKLSTNRKRRTFYKL